MIIITLEVSLRCTQKTLNDQMKRIWRKKKPK